MKIEVMFLQEYYQLAGKAKIVMDLPEESTVRDVLERLPDKIKEKIIDEKGSIKPPTDIIVNGRSIAFLEGLETKLKEGDKVVISPRPFFVV